MNSKMTLVAAALLASSALAHAESPFDSFEELWQSLDRGMSSPKIQQIRNLPNQLALGSVRVRDISENTKTNEYQIVLEVPGYAKKDLRVKPHAHPHSLTVIGEKKDAQEQKKEETSEDGSHIVHYQFSSHSSSESFNRTFRLPAEAKMNTVKATLANGLLTITVELTPKKAEHEESFIEIDEAA